MKVYTKSGDKGTTALIGGERVSKTDLRVEAYGTIDELMAFTALLTDEIRKQEDDSLSIYCQELNVVLSRLMTVSASLAKGEGGTIKELEGGSVEVLERSIDTMQAKVASITKFTIPGGNSLVSMSHVCRTVCRRAERASLRASEQYGIEISALTYLNRLSDYFYLLGRLLTQYFGVEEILWIP